MRTAYPEPDTTVPLTYSATNAARALGVGRTLLYQLVREGKVATVNIGPVKRIPVAEVERIAREGTR